LIDPKMAVDCEIYEVPMDEQGGEQEEPSSPIEKPRKERKRKPLTEEQKEKCRNNLAKARAIRKLMVEKEQKEKERIQREYEQTQLREVEVEQSEDEEELPIEDRLLKRPKPKGRTPKTKIIVEDRPNPRRRAARRRRGGDSGGDGEESEDSWESDEEPEPKRPRKTKPRAPKVKKISQKEQRLALLESKLDDIIAHTKKSMEKPRVRNTKSTTTIIQTPREASPAVNPELKRVAAKVLSMF
jgi:hypothetical protein